MLCGCQTGQRVYRWLCLCETSYTPRRERLPARECRYTLDEAKLIRKRRKNHFFQYSSLITAGYLSGNVLFDNVLFCKTGRENGEQTATLYDHKLFIKPLISPSVCFVISTKHDILNNKDNATRELK